MSQTPTQYYPPMPPMRPQPTNGLGVAGFIVSLVGFFMGCLLCPVGLLLSTIALFKRPRGFAIAGFVLGLIGSIVPLVILSIFGLVIFAAVSAGMPGVQTAFHSIDAQQAISQEAQKNDYKLPDDIEGNISLKGRQDGWGRTLRYRKLSESGFEIRSAGSDGVFETTDDIDFKFDAPRRIGPE